MSWIKAAKISDIPEGKIRSLEVGGKKIAVAHVGSEFFALDDACTHAQCSLGEGKLLDYEVECPCHGSRFDVVTGEVRFFPATVGVKTYKVRVEKEGISVEI
jgi:nitrite reductase/ring-hydroxylating ferredoxin subunit